MVDVPHSSETITYYSNIMNKLKGLIGGRYNRICKYIIMFLIVIVVINNQISLKEIIALSNNLNEIYLSMFNLNITNKNNLTLD